jgi:hypothetical protein
VRGTNPNGNWSLYAVDDSYPDPVTINGGWTLDLTTTGAVAATPTKKKCKKKHKRSASVAKKRCKKKAPLAAADEQEDQDDHDDHHRAGDQPAPHVDVGTAVVAAHRAVGSARAIAAEQLIVAGGRRLA